MSAVGLYCGSRGAGSVGGTPPLVDVLAFERWLGKPLAHALDFTGGATWDQIADPLWWLHGWETSPRHQVTYSIPMLPGTKDRPGGTLAAGAAGEYDAHWQLLAERFADNLENAVLRIGWEFNGNWYPWFAGNNTVAFVKYWQRIVDTMRAVPGSKLRFDWCPSLGRCNMENVELAWPGARYVNRIGTDVYDSGTQADPAERWNTYLTQPYGLMWHASMAQRYHKNMSHPEWGLWGVGATPATVQARGDNPLFIEQMFKWVANNPVVSACYFDVKASAEHRLATFPNSQRRFKELYVV